MSDAAPPWIAEHLLHGSYAALADRTAAVAAADPTGAARARAELAWLGAGPVHDLMAAARAALAAGDAGATSLARRAPRAVLRTGVIAAATALADELGLTGDDRARFDGQRDHPGLRWYGDDPAWWFAECCADTAEPLGAILDDPSRPAAVRWWAADRLVSGAAEVGDVAAARLWAEGAAEIEGDNIAARRVRAALWQWRDGATAEAAGLIRRVAGDIRASQPTPVGRGLLATAEAALAAIDRAGARLGWQLAGEIDAALAVALLAAPTAAHALRIGREHGLAVRATLTPALVATAAAAGATTWVEVEGQPRLARVRAIDADSGMVVVSHQGHTALMPWAQLERLSGPFGLGALILGAKVVEPDPRLARLDECDLDAHGDAPPRGFVFHTARTALAAEPTWARALWRWGQALAASFERGQVEASDVLTWYADAREHVAHASWTFATYAQVLAAGGRSQEAVLAWRDAVARAPADVVLAARCASALNAAGRAGAALAVLAPALGAAPALAGAYETAAQALLATGEPGRARAAAELELARAPDAIGAWHALVSGCERGGDGERARAVLTRARTANPGHGGLALRAAVAAGRAGAWADAHAHAADMCRLVDDGNTAALAARLRYADGDLAGAWETLRGAHARHGASEHLLAVAAQTLAALPAPARADALAPIAATATPVVLAGWAYALSETELHVEAIALADQAAAAGLPNGLWHAARCRLRHQAAGGVIDPARVIAVLTELLGPNPDYSLGRYALASVVLPGDPAAALATIDRDLGDLTPLRWLIEAEALAALGKTDDAAVMRARIADAGASIGAGAIAAARRVGTPARAAELAGVARAAGGASINLIVEHVACLAGAGDLDAAAVALAPLAERDESGPDGPIARLALRAGVLAVAAQAARRGLADLADSRTWDIHDSADPWWYLAVLAVAEPGGDARARLEAGAPRHPSAWALIAGGARGQPATAADRDRGRQLAPGLVPAPGARA